LNAKVLFRFVQVNLNYGNADLKLLIGGGSRPGHSDGRERDRIEVLLMNWECVIFVFFPVVLAMTIPIYYAAADVCVVPNHYEPFGLVAIEAMASGTSGC